MIALHRLLLVALVFTSTSAGADERRIMFHAVCVNSPECDVTGTLTLRDVGDPAIEIAYPIARGLATVTLNDRAERWEIELAADGFWMPRQAMKSEKLDVWRTTRLAGRFNPPDKADLPQSFEISAQSTFGTQGSQVPHGTTIDCPIATDGSWACAVSAVPLDLTFRVKGFTPEYRWDTKLKPGAPKSFGTVALRRGASVVAFLDRETLKQLKAPASAKLVRMVMAAPLPVSVKLSEPVVEAAFNERGMVQLAPLPAGNYSLQVNAPGFATATVPDIEVYEGKESALRHPIRLDPPLSIRINLNPPKDPWEKPWKVTLWRVAELGAQGASAGQGEVDEAGSFTAEGQAPGRYSLNVKDSRDNRVVLRQFPVRTEAEAFIAVDLVNLRLRGRVTMSDEPVAATLLFGGDSGAEQIRTNANADGEFEVVLPRAGEWKVDVREDTDGIRAAVRVMVKAGDTIEIELPETDIAGWVVGPDGKRVAAAEVGVMTAAGRVHRDADANGNFRIRGVGPGRVAIDARNRKTGEFSRVTDIFVEEGTHREGVLIELQALGKFSGALASEGQPVAGALISAYGITGGSAQMRRTVTGLEGEFELSVPAGADSILLIAAAPGRTFQAYTLSPSDSPIKLELAPVGGLVRIAWPKEAKFPLLVYNGTNIPMIELGDWLRAHGKNLIGSTDHEIPAMAPGSYRFCADKPDGRVCREGVLARGGSLSLTID